jgi:hypothetical protein
MGAIEKGTIAQGLYDCEADAEYAQDEGKWGCIPAAWRYKVPGQIRAKVERSRLSYEEGSKKTKMSADKARKLATDNGT